MSIKLFILAVLFVISGGAAFSEYFKGHKFLSLLAIAVTIIATFYLFQDIYDDLKQPNSLTQSPKVDTSASVLVPKKSTRAEIPPTKITIDSVSIANIPRVKVFNYTGGIRYEGEFIGQTRNGQGIMTWPTGERYEGEWRNDK